MMNERELQFRIELLQLLRKNCELITALCTQIGECSGSLFAAGHRMALAMGQDPDAEPLPPVMDFLNQCEAQNALTKEMMEVVKLLNRNHDQIFDIISRPTLQ